MVLQLAPLNHFFVTKVTAPTLKSPLVSFDPVSAASATFFNFLCYPQTWGSCSS